MSTRVYIFDTTLRDGTQGEEVQLSVQDKIAISQLLDSFGFSYIEGGWPGSNPRDQAFFDAARKQLRLKHARLTAFGSTRLSGINADMDGNLQALLAAETPCITIFGKSWRFQATEALRISPEENLELIADSVRYLKSRVDEVIFHAEHFFDHPTSQHQHLIGQITHLATVAIEQRYAEEKRRQDERELRQITDAIAQLISILGPEGNLLYVNRMVLAYSPQCRRHQSA